MRQVTNRIVDLFKALRLGATLGQEDALIELPNRTMSVLELPGPLKNNSPPATGVLAGDSAIYNTVIFQAGVAVAQNLNGLTFGAGLWHLRGYFRAQYAQAAPANQGLGASLRLQDPDGTQWIMADMNYIPGAVIVPIDQLLSLDRDGWLLVLSTAATVAGDFLAIRGSLVANKLL